MTAPNQRVLFEHSNAPQNVPSVSDRAELHSRSEEAAGECEAGDRGHTGVTVSEYSIHGKSRK